MYLNCCGVAGKATVPPWVGLPTAVRWALAPVPTVVGEEVDNNLRYMSPWFTLPQLTSTCICKG